MTPAQAPPDCHRSTLDILCFPETFHGAQLWHHSESQSSADPGIREANPALSSAGTASEIKALCVFV